MRNGELRRGGSRDGDWGRCLHDPTPSVRSAPMPYLIGVHASLAQVSANRPGRWGLEGSPSLHIPRYSPLPGILRLSGGPLPLQKVLDKALEDVVVMNVDSNTLETPFDDVQALPPDVVSVTPSHIPAPGS